MSTVRRPNQERAAKRISMDVPEEMVRSLDHAAARMGVNRQAVIKVWLTERLDQEAERQAARGRATV
jgi:metal-responsive CopG/Arc/MetJ family transcriptional regulator